MNEVERIKSEGWLPPSFWEEEIKNDFLITKERKALWGVLLDLLREFNRVCKKYNLRWFGIGGTILGAVRHNGFIPWDDDLDVGMMREDYEKLKTLKDEFKSPYFLGWPEVEDENGYSFLKLRNSNTTGMSKAFSRLKMNQGIFLDIFPIDDIAKETYDEDQEKMKVLTVENTVNMKGLPQKQDSRSFVEVYGDIEDLAQKDNGKGLGYAGIRVITLIPKDKLIWRKEDFSKDVDMPFETFSIKIPSGWENILKVQYGDWTKFPPIEDRGQWHSNAIFDTELPYTHYLS